VLTSRKCKVRHCTFCRIITIVKSFFSAFSGVVVAVDTAAVIGASVIVAVVGK
jgi:hypothetical protein